MTKKLFFHTCILQFALSCNQQDVGSIETKNEAPVPASELTEKNACLLSEISYCTDINAALGKYMRGGKSDGNQMNLEAIMHL